MSTIVKFSFICVIVLSLSAIAMAQSTTTGAIGGVVTNPAKEVVPNASVTAKTWKQIRKIQPMSDDQGRFKVSNLQPGIYLVDR